MKKYKFFAIQPSHPLSSPSLPALNHSQHQGLFQWVSSLHHVAQVLEFQLQHQFFQWTLRIDFLYDGLVGFPCCPRDSLVPYKPSSNISLAIHLRISRNLLWWTCSWFFTNTRFEKHCSSLRLPLSHPYSKIGLQLKTKLVAESSLEILTTVISCQTDVLLNWGESQRRPTVGKAVFCFTDVCQA